MGISLPARITNDPAKGVNVEHPELFQYGGKWYYFVAMISNPDVSVGAQNLDNKHLELFEYTNEINSLCLYGNVIYTDVAGSISKFFNRQDNHVEVGIRQMEKKSDGGGSSENPGIEQFVPTGKADFMHTFIVQNIKILRRVKQNVTYQISLISSAWYLLCSQITFSNYGPDVKKYPRNGYAMMKNFLVQAFQKNAETFKVDTDSFDNAANTSKIEIPFITNGNDNCFTVRRYIFDRLYWNKAQMDDTVKFIVFNPVDNTYRCVDYNVDASWLPAERPFIILSMFETDYEQQLYSSNNELASMAGKNATSTYEDHFEHSIWDYNPSLNRFGSDNSLKVQDIATLYNNKPETFKSLNGLQTKDKYPLELKPEWFLNEDTYKIRVADWNRSYSMYQSLIDDLMKRDAIEITTDGDITHQPGACIGNVLDRTIEKVPEMMPEQRFELYEKHRQIESLFAVLKATHRFHLATSPKSDAYYLESVTLGRNFILPPMPGGSA